MLAEYQARAVATAIYPREYRIAYPALGLIGELAELREAVAQCDSYTHNSRPVLKEAGDVMWYCANLAADLGVDLSTLDTHTLLSVFPSEKYIGDFAEKVKKLIRDGSDDKREAVLAFITLAIAAVRTTCHNFSHDFSFENVLTTNLEKLESRKERGTLQGDGDNR